MKINISENFTLAELLATRTGVLNDPSPDQVRNLVYLVEHILQPLRTALGEPVHINSGFRSLLVNNLVSGHPKSHHLCNGLFAAADIWVDLMSPPYVAGMIEDLALPFEQILVYPTFVHVSARRPRKDLRVVS